MAEKRQRAKEEIVLVALDILHEDGVDGLTLAAVAVRLGLTKPAIYHYFRSKEDLFQSLVLELLREETAGLVEAVSRGVGPDAVLGTLIRAFHRHYRSRLNAFRLVYCQFQLMDTRALGFDEDTIRGDVNPLSHGLFDRIVAILAADDTEAARRLAFSAWLAAVGLVEMIGIADAAGDPLKHSDEQLLETLAAAFDAAAERL